MSISVIAVNLGLRQAMLTNDEVIPVSGFLDRFGDDTDDPSEAEAFTAGPCSCGKYYEDSIGTFNPVSKSKLN